jgi:hypothetical protein
MENQYQKLNHKLDKLTNSTNKQNTQKTFNFQPRIINLSQIKFTKQQTQTLALGPNYALEKEPKSYINDLIIDTEVAIRQLNQKSQNVYRHIAAKQIKQILINNRDNVLHKRQQHCINQIQKLMTNNNLTAIKADKSKTIVIIKKGELQMKVNEFIRTNNIVSLNKDQQRSIKNSYNKLSRMPTV